MDGDMSNYIDASTKMESTRLFMNVHSVTDCMNTNIACGI